MSTDFNYEREVDGYGEENTARYSRGGSAQRRRVETSRRRRKSPQSVNGLHKRRRRKMTW